MNNVTEWYHKVQLHRAVLPKQLESGKSNCYVLSIKNAQVPRLKFDVPYRIHAYFYHQQQKCYFGIPFYSAWYHSVADCIKFEEVAFFWCSSQDVSIVLELIEKEHIGPNCNLYTVAWTSLPLKNDGDGISDFNFSSNEQFFTRLPLYMGSPYVLLFEADGMATEFSRKAIGSLEICLQIQPKMWSASRFISKWHIIDSKENIPGLRIFYDGGLQLIAPELLEDKICVLKQIKVSFGTDANKFEHILLHLLNNDRLYRANKSPSDINVRSMEVLERRITVGVHNGIHFVEGPQCLLLSLPENQIHDILERKQNGTKMANITDFTPHFQCLHMDGSIILTRMTADSRFAVVFSVDYLVGVNSCDGTNHSSQSIMVCWGVWCPAENLKSEGNIVIPLVGGPRINPNGRLGFRNISAFRTESTFNGHASRIKISFSYTKLGKNKLQDSSVLVNSASQKRHISLSNEEADKLQLNSIPFNKSENARNNRFRTKPLSSILPIEGHLETISVHDLEESSKSGQISSLTAVRAVDSSRVLLTVLNNISFPPIKDRNGNKPKFVDIKKYPAPDINIELNDKLNTNETIIQFMAVAFSYREKLRISVPEAVFFTMHFYRFHTITTERLMLVPICTVDDCQEQFYVLKRGNDRSNNDGRIITDDCNGFTVKYMVGRNSLPDGEADDYVKYLLSGHLIFELWDADSLLHLGTSYISLEYLLRNGSEAVQANVQSTVVRRSLPEQSVTTCKAMLRVANIGHPSTSQIDLTRSRTDAVISCHLSRVNEYETESYKVRAKPLNLIHGGALQRFLAAQKLDISQRYDEVLNITTTKIKEKELLVRPNTVERCGNKYLFEQELNAYKKLRNESKASKLLKAVFKAITTEHRIYPKYGQKVFFEFLLQNTEQEEIVVVLDIAQNTLKPLLDITTWQYYKDIYQIGTPLEPNLYRVLKEVDETAEVFIYLKPHQTVYVPFIYDGWTLPQEQIRDQVKTIFKKKIGGEPIAILDLLVEKRHVIISNSIRIYQEAETTFTKIIHITNLKVNGKVQALRCSDPLAMLSLQNNLDGSQDLRFTCRTSKAPSLQTFTVIFFGDKFYDTILEAWLIHIHAVNRINLNTVQAQPIKVPIVLRAYSPSVQFHSLSFDFKIHAADFASSQDGSIIDAVVNFIPDITGIRTTLISAVDPQAKVLLSQWMIVANVHKNNITKISEVFLANNIIQTIKLPIRNRYDNRRLFHISCSHPEYVQIKDDFINLFGNEVTDVCVTFLCNKMPKIPEMLFFVSNLENDLLEEALLFKLIYNDEKSGPSPH